MKEEADKNARKFGKIRVYSSILLLSKLGLENKINSLFQNLCSIGIKPLKFEDKNSLNEYLMNQKYENSAVVLFNDDENKEEIIANLKGRTLTIELDPENSYIQWLDKVSVSTNYTTVKKFRRYPFCVNCQSQNFKKVNNKEAENQLGEKFKSISSLYLFYECTECK